MEDISLTHGQFRILLNMTPTPAAYTDEVASLVAALHKASVSGYQWHMEMTEQDIEAAIGLFEAHQRNARTPAAKQALRNFIRSSTTAQRIDHDRHQQDDVPRETSEPT